MWAMTYFFAPCFRRTPTGPKRARWLSLLLPSKRGVLAGLCGPRPQHHSAHVEACGAGLLLNGPHGGDGRGS